MYKIHMQKILTLMKEKKHCVLDYKVEPMGAWVS